MRQFLNSGYAKWGLTAAAVTSFVVILYFSILRASAVSQGFDLVSNILSPFVYGFVLAYLLRPVCNRIEKSLYGLLKPRMKKQQRAKSLSRGLATTISILLLLFLIAGALSVVLPQLASSIYTIVLSAPAVIEAFSLWLNGIQFLDEQSKTAIVNIINNYQNSVVSWMENTILPNIMEIASQVSSGFIGAFNIVMNLIIGLIICIYVLFSKETFTAQMKKLTYTLFSKERANAIIEDVRFIDRIFNSYIVGKIIDSLIVGLICFIVMGIFDWPYVMLISVIIGVTNIIPFFGPFIGGIPSAILILTVDPMACLYFVIFIIVLQQIEGNIIAPKILGDSTGLSSFWVIFAILIGGGLFGFMGMILGVPIFAIIYAFTSRSIKKRLDKKGLPMATAEYANLDHVDETSNRLILWEKSERDQ